MHTYPEENTAFDIYESESVKNQCCYSFRFLPVTKFTFTGQVLELNA